MSTSVPLVKRPNWPVWPWPSGYVINPKLVRGLDYYSKTVFEWVTDKLGAQGTVCAGGRYDGLVEQMGGKPTSGVGFAMGIERLVLLLETLEQIPEEISRQVDVYLCAFGEAAELAGPVSYTHLTLPTNREV